MPSRVIHARGFLYSALLVAGLLVSQFLNGTGALAIRLATMLCLAFIMIHVGYEFEIDKSRPKQYAWDYLVAGPAAAFPWIVCTAYFVWVFGTDSWKDALLLARFSSPTSAGVLFSMLAAVGLAATWVFKKVRVNGADEVATGGHCARDCSRGVVGLVSENPGRVTRPAGGVS